MIEQSQQMLLEAIKAALFQITPSYSNNTDWEAVISEAKSQGVAGLISPVIPVHDESSDQGIAYYMRLMHEQDKLLKLLEAKSIPCVILKGFSAAIYYPKPYLRGMGDVDILVRRDQFEHAMKLMDSNGYLYEHGKDENGKLGKGERNIAYKKNGIEFELHHHFSSAGFDIDDILEQAIEKRKFRDYNGYRIPVLPDIENGLVLIGHINQHLVHNDLGLRQIIDWAMYCSTILERKKLDKNFKSLAEEKGLWQLVVNVTVMCEKYLGLPKTRITSQNSLAQDDIADVLIESLLASGNFGSKQVAYSVGRIRSVSKSIKRKGAFSYFQDNGLKTWKFCQKHPVFKPFAFIYGFLRFLVRGTKGIIKGGKLKEQIGYVKKKNRIDKNLGLRTGENDKR